MIKVKRITRSRIVDEVFESLRQAILDRDFAPGERLEVCNLAADFNVSQMPVRQAIDRLQALGLVEVKPRSGTFIAQVNPDELFETFDIRNALECLAIESAVATASDAQLAELYQLLSEMDQYLAKGLGAQKHDSLNLIFHRRIVELSGNRKLVDLYEELQAHIKIARVHARSSDWSKRVQRAQDEHHRILSALTKRDAAEAKQALRDHIERAKQDLIYDNRELQAKGAS